MLEASRKTGVVMSMDRDCTGVINLIDEEIRFIERRIGDIGVIAANVDMGLYPTDPVMAYGPITSEEKWIYENVERIVRNEQSNIEILKKMKKTAEEKCQVG